MKAPTLAFLHQKLNPTYKAHLLPSFSEMFFKIFYTTHLLCYFCSQVSRFLKIHPEDSLVFKLVISESLAVELSYFDLLQISICIELLLR